MRVLAHRGWWKSPDEQNTATAFKRAFHGGFGVETDLRDAGGQIVIAHDLPLGHEMTLDDFFELYMDCGSDLPLALNIKADGLSKILVSKIKQYGIHNFFVFDMSAPDTVSYQNLHIPFYTRHSDYEADPILYDGALGVWMDEFCGHWITELLVHDHIQQQKRVCIVSPELHGRPYLAEWRDYREVCRRYRIEELMICTDYPEEARSFFND